MSALDWKQRMSHVYIVLCWSGFVLSHVVCQGIALIQLSIIQNSSQNTDLRVCNVSLYLFSSEYAFALVCTCVFFYRAWLIVYGAWSSCLTFSLVLCRRILTFYTTHVWLISWPSFWLDGIWDLRQVERKDKWFHAFIHSYLVLLCYLFFALYVPLYTFLNAFAPSVVVEIPQIETLQSILKGSFAKLSHQSYGVPARQSGITHHQQSGEKRSCASFTSKTMHYQGTLLLLHFFPHVVTHVE